MTPISGKMVAEVYKAIAEKHGLRLVGKGDSAIMKFIGSLAPILGIPKADFLEQYATTLGHTIYLPFVPGTPNEYWSLPEQLEVLAHERRHVNQWREAPLRYAARYLTSRRARGRYELAAYCVSAQVRGHLYRMGCVGQPSTSCGKRISDNIRRVYWAILPDDAATRLQAALSELDAPEAVELLRVWRPQNDA